MKYLRIKALFLAAIATLFMLWVYGWNLRTWVFLVCLFLFFIHLFFYRTSDQNSKNSFSFSDFLPKRKYLAASWIWVFAGILYVSLGQFAGRGFTAQMHDEYAYLFQAKTFSNGKLSYPSPVHPEFFEAFHILTEPVYAAKYPPGHAFILVPGVLLGYPILMPLLLSTGSLVILYFLIKIIKGENYALIGTALFSISPLQIQMATSYQPHSTTLFFLLLFSLAIAKSFENVTVKYSLLAGMSLGIAFLTRPVTACAFAVPFLTVLLWQSISELKRRKSQKFRNLLIVNIAFAPFLCFLLLYNFLLLGNPFKFPWIEYARSYLPADQLGFSVDNSQPQQSESPRMAAFYKDFVLPMKSKYNFPRAVKQLFAERIPKTFQMADDSIGLVLFLPLAFLSPLVIYEKMMLASVISLWLTQFTYYGGHPRYHFEAIPFIIFFIVRGTENCLGILSRMKNQLGYRFFTLHLLGGIIFLFSFKFLYEYYSPNKFTAYHAAFYKLINSMGPGKRVIFVRYGPKHDFHYDLINNEPDLQKSQNIYVLDLAEKNRILMKEFEGRSFYIFEEEKWKLGKLD